MVGLRAQTVTKRKEVLAKVGGKYALQCVCVCGCVYVCIHVCVHVFACMWRAVSYPLTSVNDTS